MSQNVPGVPAAPLPVLPLRSGALLPGVGAALPIGRERSLVLVESLRVGDELLLAAQRDPAIADPRPEDLHPIATLARVRDVARSGGREVRLGVDALGRVRLGDVTRAEPFLLATHLPVEGGEAPDLEALRERARALGGHAAAAASLEEPGLALDRIAIALEPGATEAVELLQAVELRRRAALVDALVGRVESTRRGQRRERSDESEARARAMREAALREQLRQLQRELGDERHDAALDSLRERLEQAGLPPEARAVADRELKRLEALPPGNAEHHVVRTYLELIADLPWSARADVHEDLDAVAKKLDEDHFGLEDVKKRILEQLAVHKLSGNPRGTLLCLAGPPGVGKTSLGQSIADATGRPMVRVALGGVRDEAEIRGHRRTYVGAMPGRIVGALKKAKVKNPVVLLDEIDKLGTGWGGSPEAALLEVLDPEQNRHFADHYLELPFDLSEVLFVCTANTLETLSAPLRDRLEILELSGYTPEEKVRIARGHLLPRALAEHGLRPEQLDVDDGAIRAIVRDFTREAGVRQLGREIGKVCRAAALRVAREPGAGPVVVREEDVGSYLGKVRFFNEVAERTAEPGVATGLAWTPVGGEILFIETSRMPGQGRLEITGQLGDVMKESAKAALTYVRSRAPSLGIAPEAFEKQDLHIHVPAGAVPKDGPSAGVTMFTALTSLLTGRRVRPDTAMTGECTLRGRVLPVGGIKSKVLAAHRAGIRRVVLPKQNARDLDEVPAEVRRDMEIVLAEDMARVLELALEPAAPFEDGVQRKPGEGAAFVAA